jgi:uncharacterized protein with HEPN domain
MSSLPLERLRHIRDECAYLHARVQNLTQDRFVADEDLKRAFVRSLEIIGEATTRISPEFRPIRNCSGGL